MESIEARDRSDRERAVGPLRRTDEQIYLDTSGMDVQEVVGHLAERIENG
jgi:cytidylate kinase